MTTDLLSPGNNEGNLPGDINASSSIGGISPNIQDSGPLLRGPIPIGSQLAFQTGSNAAMTGGTVMGVGPGVGDDAQDATYSTKNNQQFEFGTGGAGQTTTTTTTTTTQQYGYGTSSVGAVGEGGLSMGIGSTQIDGNGLGLDLGSLGTGQTTTTTTNSNDSTKFY